jgi:hypothetical protein
LNPPCIPISSLRQRFQAILALQSNLINPNIFAKQCQ